MQTRCEDNARVRDRLSRWSGSHRTLDGRVSGEFVIKRSWVAGTGCCSKISIGDCLSEQRFDPFRWLRIGYRVS